MVETAQTYNRHAYMYIEYPHKSYWSPGFGAKELRAGLAQQGQEPVPLLLYVHFPYCERQCFYCTCHTEISSNHERYRAFLGLLMQEMDLYQRFFDEQGINPAFVEVHLGGGSPTLLKKRDFAALVDRIDDLVGTANLREFAIEVDPRHTDPEKLRFYQSQGINRISLGIQDFDPAVQQAINRVQPIERIEPLMAPDVRGMFPHGVNFDILCGLPHQTPESIQETFRTVAELAPDRICLNHLHFAPEFSPHQRFMVDGQQGRPSSLPGHVEKRILFRAAQDVLEAHGYLRTGYDHFAKPDDDVARALDAETMHWNSLGVTSGAYRDVLGIGPHSTSTLFNTYAQNVYGTQAYQEKIRAGELPLQRGVVLNHDDLVRRRVIQTLRNYSCLDYGRIEAAHDLCFTTYFAESLQKLQVLEQDGLVVLSDRCLQVTELGQEFVLQVCACFDAYLERD